MKTVNKERPRVFTVELKMKESLKNIAVSNGVGEGVFLEGILGQLVEARFEENVILEVIGSGGVLRVDLGFDEITGRVQQ